jgi:anti-sigma28 factor (negative regulator of flagellin synthesis)
MNINQDPLRRREAAQTPPTPEEREAMRATRERVRADESARRAAALERIHSARTPDRIEISTETQRRIEASQAEKDARRINVERLREAYQSGDLNTDTRRSVAAERMLGSKDV